MDSQSIEAMVRNVGDARAVAMVLAAVMVGFVVLLIQIGFGLLATGMVRSKNAAHTMAMSFMVFAVGVLGYWVSGFALQHLAVGARGFFFSPSSSVSSSLGSSSWFGDGTAGLFVFGLVGASVAATIPTGAAAERIRLVAVALLAFLTAAAIYPVYAHWVWGGGWLAALGKHGLGHGVVDAGGAGVVHLTGGLLALVAAKWVGPRLGKYGLRGDVRPIPAHNMPLVVLGTLVLASGWFAVTASASLFSRAGQATSPVTTTVVNTLLACAAGATMAYLHTRLRFGKPDLSMMCNGLLAGLVAISACGGFVGSTAAVVTGALGSLFAVEGALAVEKRLKIDDPTGAFSVHGLGGAWGLLALGLFADGRAGDGLNGVDGPVQGLVTGHAGQLGASLVGIVANLVWVLPVAAILLTIVGRVVAPRVTADDEIGGLDVPELGMTGYVTEAIHAGTTRGSEVGHGGRSSRVVESRAG